MNLERELPADTLPNQPGMHLLSGYLAGKFRYRVYVPTTICDPLEAHIRMYKPDDFCKNKPDSPEIVVAKRVVALNSMPRWNVEYQAIDLSTRDKRRVLQELDHLERNASRLEKKLKER